MAYLPRGSLLASRFEIDQLAGPGGMGAVYRARGCRTGDGVALKLRHGDSVCPDPAERFEREAQLSPRRHPAIVYYVARKRTPQGQRFLAMQWLAGQEIGQRLARGPMTVNQCVTLLEQVASALTLAPQRGAVHCELKPTNLFLPTPSDVAPPK